MMKRQFIFAITRTITESQIVNIVAENIEAAQKIATGQISPAIPEAWKRDDIEPSAPFLRNPETYEVYDEGEHVWRGRVYESKALMTAVKIVNGDLFPHDVGAYDVIKEMVFEDGNVPSTYSEKTVSHAKSIIAAVHKDRKALSFIIGEARIRWMWSLSTSRHGMKHGMAPSHGMACEEIRKHLYMMYGKPFDKTGMTEDDMSGAAVDVGEGDHWSITGCVII